MKKTEGRKSRATVPLRETRGYSLMGYVWEAGADGERWDQGHEEQKC
jgi:hypothetical protein